MKTYFRILSFARPFRKFLPLFIIVTLLSIVFELLNLSFIAPVLKILFSENAVQVVLQPMPEFEFSEAYFSEMGNWFKNYLLSFDDKTEALKVICIVLLGSVFLANLFTFLSRFILAFVKARMVKNMRMAIYKKVNKLHLGYFTNENRGDLISRMTNDVQEVEASIIATIRTIIKRTSNHYFNLCCTVLHFYRIGTFFLIGITSFRFSYLATYKDVAQKSKTRARLFRTNFRNY